MAHRCGGVLAQSSLQNCFNSATLEGFGGSCHSSSIGFKSVDVTGHTPSKKFSFGLISPQNICPKVSGIIKIFSGKCEMSLCVIFGQQWVLPLNFAMDAVFAQSLSYC